jgi:hypothetical protein
MSETSPITTLSGQVVKHRKVSKHLVFSDLISTGVTKETVEVVFKTSDGIPSVKEALAQVNLGDIVSLVGYYEIPSATEERTHKFFKATSSPSIITKWSDTSSLPFTPVFTMCQPIQQTNESNACISPTTTLCKYYTNENKCPRNPCPYVHTDDKVLRGEYFSEKAISARVRESAVTGSNVSNAALKSQRAAVLCDYIIDKFSLTPESHVLDVAGGRGDLCFELTELNSVPCTTVDPRGRKLNKKQLKYLKAKKRDREDCLWGKHISGLFLDDFFETHAEVDEVHPDRIDLIVGLHPDQATESIINVALANSIPFCIVPCCVFPASGVRDMSFEQWVEYLMRKDERIEKGWLDVKGKNLVLSCECGRESKPRASVDTSSENTTTSALRTLPSSPSSSTTACAVSTAPPICELDDN